MNNQPNRPNKISKDKIPKGNFNLASLKRPLAMKFPLIRAYMIDAMAPMKSEEKDKLFTRIIKIARKDSPK